MLRMMMALTTLVNVKDCGSSGDIAQYLSGSFEPIPPVANQNATLSFTYNLKQDVTDGTATYSYNINYIPFPDDVFPLCTQTACPLTIGQHTETSTDLFPSGVSGRIVNTIRWADQNGDPILCVQTTMSL